MEKSRIKEILIKMKERKEWDDFKCESYRRAYHALKRYTKRGKEKESINGRWLYENFYLLEESYATVKNEHFPRRLRAISAFLAEAMADSSDIQEGISAFFETVSDTFSDEEIEKLYPSLLLESIILIKKELVSGGEVSVYINLIRRLSEFDFSPFYLGFFSYEQSLRRDPLYQRLDRETKALYKQKIKKYAKKRGMTFSDACVTLASEAEEEKCHIGELLDFSRSNKGWLYLYASVFIALLYLSFKMLFLALQPLFALPLFLLTIIPLKECAFMLIVPIVAFIEKPEILPRILVGRVGEENATLTVTATLLTNESDVKRAFRHLENLSLKTRSRGKDDGEVYYGVLSDLPESDTKKTRTDEKIKAAAKKEVDRLNSLYGNRFSFFSRERVKDEKSGRFVAWERKRGAINELVKLLSGIPSKLETCGAVLPKIKYVVTLDSDTDMELGALNKMIGTMAHPLNRPVIEEKRGVKRVVRGFGILQPTVVASLESAHATGFSSLMTGVGGIDSYHGAVFNLNHILFGKGIFCGKGIFDVEAYRETVLDAFPDGIILSHDILEGTRLLTGHLSDVTVFDSVPSGVVSYYKRAHRWARGDVQSMRFVTPFVPSPGGYVKNPMEADERFVFINNFLNLLMPVCQITGLFFMMGYVGARATLIAFFLLLPLLTPFVIEVLRSVLSGRLETVIRRFFGDTFTTICRELIMVGYRLSSLAFVAYNNADAIVRAFWRMAVSKKKLLEWTTAGSLEGKKSPFASVLLYTLPSVVAGAFALLFARFSVLRLLGILWCLFPVFSYFLSTKKTSYDRSRHYRHEFLRYARDIWRYFEKYVDASGNFLPPDNVSVFPSSEIAMRTSPTNIGLYLLSVLAAMDFGFISASSGVDRLEKTLGTIEKLPKYKGQLYNWYSTVTLDPIGKEYISTVDCGNFVTSLVALFEGLSEYEMADKRIAVLKKRIKAIEEASEFRFLYNSKRELFALGFFPDREEQDGIVYDMYMSEARTTDYYAVARGIVKESHWSMLSRPLTTSGHGVGALSWSGTAFEFFMPHLLLPVFKNSFTDEALNFAFFEQFSFGVRVGRERIFGISESGYFAFDEALCYQYRAFGVPALSRSRESEEERVISPYSSFLMLKSNIPLNMRNLRALERLGMYGECGFYEAIDATEKRVGKTASTVKSFMCHHLGMSLVSLANASFENVFVRRFMADREMKAVSELLKESVPVDAVSVKKEKGKREALKEAPRKTRTREKRVFKTAPATGFLSGRDHTMILSERGVVEEKVKIRNGEYVLANSPVSDFNPVSVFLFSTDGEEIISPSVSDDVSFSFDSVCAEYKMSGLHVRINLSAKTAATRISLSATGREGEVGVYFEPVLKGASAYLSHPAYVNLFFSAEYDKESRALILSSSGSEPAYLALMCSEEYFFETSKLRLFEGKEYSLSGLCEAVKRPKTREVREINPISPCVLAKVKYSGRTDTTFVIGYGKTKAEALYSAKDEIKTSLYKSVEKSRELYLGALSATGGGEGCESAFFEVLLSVFEGGTVWKIKSASSVLYGKNALYRYGISGELPIFDVKEGVKNEELSELIRCKKLLYIMGARFDLVIEVADMGYSRGGRHEIEKIIDREGCRFMLGKSGGIFLADISEVGVSELFDAVAKAHYPEKEKLTRFSKTERYTSRRKAVDFQGYNEGITEDGYIIDLREKAPSVLWSHVIAHPTFGTILNHRSLGNTWVFNSRLSRLTYFEGDPVGGGASEKIILSEKNFNRDLLATASFVKFTVGGAEYLGDSYRIRVAVHPTLLFKAVSVRVDSDDFALRYKFIPVLDDFPHNTTVIEYGQEMKNLCTFRNLFSDGLKKGLLYLFAPFETEMRVSRGEVEVVSHKPSEIVFVMGYAGSDRHLEEVKSYFSEKTFRDLWKTSRTALEEKIKGAVFKSTLNVPLTDMWLPYQILVSRFYARSGPYQSGGAWGFRDQAQDCLSVIDMDKNAVRAHIFRMASHQYLEGDVCHWWHFGRGVRTRCSDDYLWLVLLACSYIERTGDKKVLGIEAGYLTCPPLSPKEKDRYSECVKSEVRENLKKHLERALDLFVERGVGEHGLPFIGDGDWNDGLNGLPEGSESVWLGFFGRIVIHKYLEVVEENPKYRAFSESLRLSIEKNAFFFDRYARAFTPHGEVLGIGGGRVEIDALSAAFASICHSITGDGNMSRITLALDSSWKELFDEKAGIYKLFTPPFSEYDEEIGYISAYPEGIRENGGQYTHGAVWAALGFLLAPDKKEENTKRAMTLARLFSPLERGEEYKTEPYALAGDIYANPDHLGRGGWSWYTGAASWYRKLLLMFEEENRNNFNPFS